MAYRKNVFLLFCLLICLAINFLLAPLLLGSRPASLAFARLLSTPTPVPTIVPHDSTGDLAYPEPRRSLKNSFVPLSFHGNASLPEVALTFDDGPFPIYTTQILSILQHYGVHATFFELGAWVQHYSDLAQAVVADGHTVGDHSWSHPDLSKLSAAAIQQQLATTITQMQQTLGIHPMIFRPPYGSYDRRVLDIASSLQLSTIMWNIDPRDWSRPGADYIVRNVLSNLHNGSIILLHDGGGNRSQTVQALPTIIEQAQARGFQFVTIPQMLAHLEPGKAANFSLGDAPPLMPTPQPGGQTVHMHHYPFFVGEYLLPSGRARVLARLAC